MNFSMRTTVIAILVAAVLVFGCMAGLAFALSDSSPSQPTCIGGQWDGDECDFPEDDDL